MDKYQKSIKSLEIEKEEKNLLKDKLKQLEERFLKADVYTGIISDISCLRYKIEVTKNRIKSYDKQQLSNLSIKHKIDLL
jgi:signal recognition particle GTPase